MLLLWCWRRSVDTVSRSFTCYCSGAVGDQLTLSAGVLHVTALVLEETSQYSQQVDSGVLTAVMWREKQDVLILTPSTS